MPRKRRPYVAGVPCHIVQRGNNRQACFFCDDDFGFYMKVLTRSLEEFEVELHAFVLMTNHVHLLMTPSNAQGISKVMQSVGRRYVRYINTVYGRTGTLWEGRHKASLIESDAYLIICQKYIELNPVRAQMVQNPWDYYWSSYQANALGKKISGLTPHDLYLRLGRNAQERMLAYKDLFKDIVSTETIKEMRECLCHSYPLGNEKFKQQIEQTHRIRFGQKKPGRPRKA